MAIGDAFKGLGQRLGRGLVQVGGYDPRQQVSAQEAARRRNIGLEALQRSFGKSAAILSGDPQRLAMAQQQEEAARKRKLREDFLAKNPQYAQTLRALEAGIPAGMLTPKTAKGPSSYEEYIRTDSTPTEAEYLAFLEKQKKAGATQINLDQKRDTIFAQEAAKAAFATKKEVDKQIEQDRQLLSRVQMSKRLLQDGIKTGKVEEILMPLRELAIGLGVADEETISNYGQQELFQSLTNYLVPRMRVEGSGSTSDMEIDLFRSAVPNMGRTAEGNLVIAAGIENLVAYNIKRQRLMDNYIKENKNLLGFGEYADKELGALYKSYNSDNEFDELVKAGLLNAGDFVYDGINGQFRVLKQEDVL